MEPRQGANVEASLPAHKNRTRSNHAVIVGFAHRAGNVLVRFSVADELFPDRIPVDYQMVNAYNYVQTEFGFCPPMCYDSIIRVGFDKQPKLNIKNQTSGVAALRQRLL